MKRKSLGMSVLVLGLTFCFAQTGSALPMGTAWTYQGRLVYANQPADGLYDFQFKLFDDPNVILGNQVGIDVNKPNVDVIDGYFTAELDFGSDVFDGNSVWLETGVRPGDSNDPNAFVTLSPRQEITPVPYALQTRGIFVDNSGNVGIGTKTPAIIAGQGRYLTVSSGLLTSLELQGLAIESGNTVSKIDFIHKKKSGDFQNIARIDARMISGTESGGKLVFSTYDGSILGAPMSIGPMGKVKILAKGEIGGVSPRPTVLIMGNSIDDPFYVRTSRGEGLVVKNNGDVGIGTHHPQANLDVAGWTRTEVLEISGGSDLSEQFEITGEHQKVEPGMVVCIDPSRSGDLVVSQKAYDRTVAGIVSGAGGVKPGMLMGQKGTMADGEYPVSLTGRVYCWADASNASIIPGDLLTTSEVAGHAMKVTDYNKAQGAILGKAMSSLSNGRGLVLVLVTLQ